MNRDFLALASSNFIGTLIDGVVKNAVLILVAYEASSQSEAGYLSAAGMLLFMLPYFFMAGIAGQIADRSNQVLLFRILKVIELFVLLMVALLFCAKKISLL